MVRSVQEKTTGHTTTDHMTAMLQLHEWGSSHLTEPTAAKVAMTPAAALQDDTTSSEGLSSNEESSEEDDSDQSEEGGK